MSSQWLILLTIVSFLYLTVTGNRYYSAIDKDSDNNINPNENFPSNIQLRPSYIDTSYYYRLKNAYTGRNFALEIIKYGNDYVVKMAPVSNNPGQFWRFVELEDNVYSLRTLSLKNEYSLTIVNYGRNTRPHVAKTARATEYRWRLTRLNDGTFKLSNDFRGDELVLDVYSDSHVAYMSKRNADYTGQHWSFYKIGRIEDY